MPSYITIPGVELGHVGMDWDAVSGPVTFTLEHLADVQRAAMDDPHVNLPIVKLGHTAEIDGQPRFVSALASLGDGAPSFGRVENLSLANDGGVLVGDLVSVPEWVPQHYPRRSGEWSFGHELRGITTPGGKHYTCVLSAMALLGEIAPAITTLDDLEAFIEGGPEAVQTTGGISVPQDVQTSVSADTIAHRFWTEFADGDRYWWWPVDIRVDPLEVIADDDEGHLWRVPVTTDGADAIDFAEPVRVRETFVDVPEAVATAAAEERVRRVYVPDGGTPAAVATSVIERREQRTLAHFHTAAEARPTDRAARPQTARIDGPDNEETPMDDNVRQVLERQGLDPETATEEQITAAEAFASVAPAPQSEGEITEPEAEGTPEGEPQPEPVATSATQIDPETLAGMQREIAASRADRERREAAERDRILTTAVLEGRFPPGRREHYAQAFERDPDGTRTLLTAEPDEGGLARNLVPVTEIGDSGASSPSEDAAHDQFMTTHFPAAARRRGRATAGA